MTDRWRFDEVSDSLRRAATCFRFETPRGAGCGARRRHGRDPPVTAGSHRGLRKVTLELRGVRGVAVDDFRVEHLFFLGELERLDTLADRNAPVEAGPIADVTAGALAGDGHLEPDAVLIVVDHELRHLLDESARRAFVPEDLAAAAPVVGFTGLDRLAQ